MALQRKSNEDEEEKGGQAVDKGLRRTSLLGLDRLASENRQREEVEIRNFVFRINFAHVSLQGDPKESRHASDG